jgi:asparagine synthase (glutamine-hydrolysing)
MCGIVGQVFQNQRCNPEVLVAMRDTMSHRGPDDAGEWYSPDSRIGLAHRRLAIIDLSPLGRQPMHDDSGQLVIVFNGEIYNFRDLRKYLEKRGHTFGSKSDTEVILRAYREWGLDCLKQLNGMFAFCIYDDRRRILFLARDRAGEKPLYYSHSNGRFAFASELRALIADPETPRKLNPDAVNYYLAYGYVPCPMSIVDGIEKLPQGHAMVYDIDSGSLKPWRYWDLPEPLGDNNASMEELCTEFESLLRDSVRRQMVSDVPIGVLLSGGCDSSLVAAFASEISAKPLRTFTVSFPGHKKYDEAPFARIVADHFRTEHIEIVADDPSAEVMLELAARFDEPLADHAIIPTYFVSRAIREYATVALSGDGGDELFGGYPHYSALLRLERSRRFVPSSLRSLIAKWAFSSIPVGIRYRNHVIGFEKDFGGSVAHINLYFDEQSRRQLLNPEIVSTIDTGLPEREKAMDCVPRHSPLRKAMQTDFVTTLADGYLAKVDRASMLASIEVRAPFLDYRMIEFAYRSVPDKYKVAQGQTKILTRYSAKRLLPAALNLQRKQGFTMPISKWLAGNWGRFIQSVLREDKSSLFDRKFVVKLFDYEGRIKSNTNRLYALTILELWCRLYGATI